MDVTTDIYPSDTNPADIDIIGNIALHHAACPPHQNTLCGEKYIERVQKLLEQYPDGALTKNQFDRIPLHYSLDCSSPCYQIVRLLVNAYPRGIWETDVDNISPYDLALKWGHGSDLLLILLEPNRDIDKNLYLSLKYGKLYIFHKLLCSFGGSKVVQSENELSEKINP